MPKRSSKHAAASATRREPSDPPSNKRNLVEQLQLLRSFVEGSFREADLTDCLRQCDYNVERAAEQLLTGQYQSSTATITQQGDDDNIVDLSTSPPPKVPPPQSARKAAIPFSAPPRTASTKKTATVRRVTPLADPRTRERMDSVEPPPPQNTAVQQPQKYDTASWLLCRRWISNALCTCQGGPLAHQEVVTVTPASPGMVRWQSSTAQGRLPEDLGSFLAPLLRAQLVTVTAHALMQERRLAMGAHVPLALQVSLPDPVAFFQLFATTGEAAASSASSAAQYFETKRKQSQSQSKGASSKKKHGRPLPLAAFELLQWAQYGEEMPDFSANVDSHEEEEKEDASDNENEKEKEDEEAWNEEDFEAADETSDQAKKLEESIVADKKREWHATLPLAPDPAGFQDGVTLRPYQQQALYWMLQRESATQSRQELEDQLHLLSELAAGGSDNKKNTNPFFNNKKQDVVCECSPVQVSEAARARATTVTGEVNPVAHPLWQARYLLLQNTDNNDSDSQIGVFYVNELMGVATHQPPAPPTPCSGGILADAMGLGKTVMLMALILASKQERPASYKGPVTTLVVAKLSLLSQWEDELKTKTDLTYRIYYGATKGLSVEELQSVDVVVTTYGSVQGELQRKSNSSMLVNCSWLRVILDEAHCIRNDRTLASKVCCNLEAKHRWCVSGTIIQNSLDDVFGIIKFLRHEPWCLPSFWKAAVTRPMQALATATKDSNDDEAERDRQVVESMATAMDRVRRLLGPLMLRRSKDSLTADGEPILTLPPVVTKTVQVTLSESEREFYNAILARSLEIFDGFVESGTASRSYIQILTMLQRLRQACDHIALTVKSRLCEEDREEEEEGQTAPPAAKKQSARKEAPAVRVPSTDTTETRFLEDLLEKFCRKSSPRKQKREDEPASPSKGSPTKKVRGYVSSVAYALSAAVNNQSTHVEEECPICLEQPLLSEAVLTPCAHIFCRTCLVGTLSQRAGVKTVNGDCPDGECPCCNAKIDARRIIALSQTANGETGQEQPSMTATYLKDLGKEQTVDTKPLPATVPAPRAATSGPTRSLQSSDKIRDPHAAARQILQEAVTGTVSSKMRAILDELEAVWEQDPGSKVLIFSHYLGFLDLLRQQLDLLGVDCYRLDGSLSLAQRMQVLDGFRGNKVGTSRDNNKKSAKSGTVLLMSMSAGAEGLNLVAASTCFICEPWWNAAKEDQCVNRIHRIGQTADSVRVVKFCVVDSVEERIIALQGRKQYVAGQIYKDAAKDGDGGEGQDNQAASARLSLEEFKLIFGK